MPKILMTTYGSYGDLNPYLGMARVLQNHGHEITIATHDEYREQVERIGVCFVPLKPGLEDLGSQGSWAARANHPLLGTQFIVQTLIMPYLQDSYRAIKAAAIGHDLIISHVLTFAAPVVAEELKIPWVSTALQPSPFFSAHDPPALGPAPFLPKLKFLGPKFMRWFMTLLAKPTNAWSRPVHELRKQLGLPSQSKNLLIDGYSALGTLALFPSAFATAQPDWPNAVKQVGFPLFDEESTSEISPELRSFLASGPPPVVFTLGTAIVQMETPYFEIAYQAVKSLGWRAVFLAGKTPRRIPTQATTDPGIHISTYEPFSGLFPHGLVIVHQCGIGTTSQALASGRPQILVPFAHDQPDNARIVAKLGLGLSIPSRRLTAARLNEALRTVTQSETIIERANEFARQLRSESFPEQLCNAVTEFLEPTAARVVRSTIFPIG